MILGLTKVVSIIGCLSLNIAQSEFAGNINPVLSIPKIDLNQEFYPNDNVMNNVDKGLQVIDGSAMPSKKGNLILAAHSGNSSIAYFKNLDMLSIGDEAYVYYKGYKYSYIISDIYDVEKTGLVSIKRDLRKQTLTLITCKKNTNKQIVFIGYLTSN